MGDHIDHLYVSGEGHLQLSRVLAVALDDWPMEHRSDPKPIAAYKLLAESEDLWDVVHRRHQGGDQPKRPGVLLQTRVEDGAIPLLGPVSDPDLLATLVLAWLDSIASEVEGGGKGYPEYPNTDGSAKRGWAVSIAGGWHPGILVVPYWVIYGK